MSSTLNDSIVQIPYGELKKLEQEITEARFKIRELEARPLAITTDVANTKIKRLTVALDAALDALGVYTARVSPYEVKGLPAAKLCFLVSTLMVLMDHTDTCDTLLELVDEIDSCEAKRAANPKPKHVATGEDWQAGREAFEREFGVDPSTYRDGGLAGVIRARATKEAKLQAEAAIGIDETDVEPGPGICRCVEQGSLDVHLPDCTLAKWAYRHKVDVEKP